MTGGAREPPARALFQAADGASSVKVAGGPGVQQARAIWGRDEWRRPGSRRARTESVFAPRFGRAGLYHFCGARAGSRRSPDATRSGGSVRKSKAAKEKGNALGDGELLGREQGR